MFFSFNQARCDMDTSDCNQGLLPYGSAWKTYKARCLEHVLIWYTNHLGSQRLNHHMEESHLPSNCFEHHQTLKTISEDWNIDYWIENFAFWLCSLFTKIPNWMELSTIFRQRIVSYDLEIVTHCTFTFSFKPPQWILMYWWSKKKNVFCQKERQNLDFSETRHLFPYRDNHHTMNPQYI